jgi:DNA modification methylase
VEIAPSGTQAALIEDVVSRSPARGTSDIHRHRLLERYCTKLSENPDLNRALVSFQANKGQLAYRWFNYREGFSSRLVSYVLRRYGDNCGRVLDPFAGAGVTLTTAAEHGYPSTGIELLPVAVAVTKARIIANRVNVVSFRRWIERLEKGPRTSPGGGYKFPHLRITERAFPEETERDFAVYNGFLELIEDEDIRYLFRFAWMSVLEAVSYTRKDGQYLRWDLRSGRVLKSRFQKGEILDFWPAIRAKLMTMLHDILARNGSGHGADIEIIEGSSLLELPILPCGEFGLVITSPPYCNRYDYTRTYGLELAFLGYDESMVRRLRQGLVSATVENRPKREALRKYYAGIGASGRFDRAGAAFANQDALHEVLDHLYAARRERSLNNLNIPTMVENYFFELNLVIHELSRVLVPGGRLVMVNDNVRYAGEEIPVDLILSDLAERAGLATETIWVLPRGKGNSSQQMGRYGRRELRKCVYVWRKK